MGYPMNIGKAAETAGVSPKMIRHYEQIGLLPAAARTESGYRQYSARDVSILRFIRQARRMGFSMQQISDLLGMWSNDHRTSREVKALAMAHLADLDQKMREIAEMKGALERLVAACHGDEHPHCAIIDELAVESPAAPAPGTTERKAVPKASPKTLEPRGKARDTPNTSHVDLMAWALGVWQRPANR